jgi:hypothetical protein
MNLFWQIMMVEFLLNMAVFAGDHLLWSYTASCFASGTWPQLP